MIKRILIFIAIVGAVMVLIRVGYAYEWTGFGSSIESVDPKQKLVPAKTLWDWLGLLIIPIVLAIGGLWFSRAERRNEQNIARQRIEEEQNIARQRIEEDRKIAQERIEEERRIAEQNTQQVTLQAYLEQMSGLLLDKDLRHSEPESESRAIARAWTLTVLRRLNDDSKGLLLRFLYESDLILKDTTIISLAEAPLDGANLELANLGGANLELANLGGANLGGANLGEANLGGANLQGAHLQGAHLTGAHLEVAKLVRATLTGAYLAGAHLKFANLKFANLEFANLTGAHLTGAHLTGAHLEFANLAGATLTGAYLAGAHLGEASLEGAHLERADLQGVTYNNNTRWPVGFDPKTTGAIFVEEEQDHKL